MKNPIIILFILLLTFLSAKAQLNTNKILYKTDEEVGEVDIPFLPGELCIRNCPIPILDSYNNAHYQSDYYRVNTAINTYLWGCKRSSRGGCIPIETVNTGDYFETKFVFSPLEKGIFTMEERRKIEEWNGSVRRGITKIILSDESLATFEIRVMDFSWKADIETISQYCYQQERIINFYDYLSDDFEVTENVTFYIDEVQLSSPNTFQVGDLALGGHTLKAVGVFDNGTKEITYELLVQEISEFNFDLPEKVCKNEGDINLFDYVVDTTGVFDSNPTVDIAMGVFPITIVPSGTYEISYTLRNVLGCQRTVTQLIEVPDEENLDFDLPVSICQSVGEINLLDYVNIKTGTFTIGDSLDLSALWDVSKVNAQAYTITYAIENSSDCTQTITKSINVEATPPAPSFLLPENICQSAVPINLYDLVEPKSGTFFSESPNFESNPFDPSKMNKGVHTISYVFENEAGCQSTTVKNIEIGTGLTVDAGEDLIVCPSSPVITLAGLPEGGNWAGDGMDGNQFNGTNIPEGIYEVIYTYENEGCVQTDSILITVAEELSMDFTADKTEVGQGEKVTFSTTTQAEKYLWKVEGNSFDYEAETPFLYFYADHYEVEKYFDVTLIATIGNCSWELKKEEYIHLKKEASDGVITSLDDNQVNHFEIYPNPFESQLHIELPVKAKYDIAVYNLSGQLVHEQRMDKTGVLQISMLEMGIYILKIQNNATLKIFKIQKK
ncbi:MAG: T9SS type A sorting domain-containing protein [Bacteroidota bacterium]